MRMMKRIIAMMLLLLFAFPIFTGCEKLADREITDEDIVILFTNDIHCNGENNMGYSGLAAYKKECLNKTSYVSLVDCGDAIKDEMFGLIGEEKYIVSFLNIIMNEVGYDLASFGNHEFDFGLDKVEKMLEGSKASYLACNIAYHGEGDSFYDYIKPYVIKEYGDKKVGFVAVVTPRTVNENREHFFEENGKVVYDFCGDRDGQELYECVQKNVDECKKEGADYVVLLSHLGNTQDKSPFTSVELIKHTTGIDVVLDAHSHSIIEKQIERNKDKEEVIITSAGSDFSHIGQLVIFSDGKMHTSLISEYEERDEAVDQLVENMKYFYESDWEKLNALIKEEIADTDYAAHIDEPKNIILMIGDGMGYNIVEATERLYADKLEDGTLNMNQLPVKGSSITYSASHSVTDSAAGATALATGYKTSNKTIAMDAKDEDTYKTILEIAHEKGKSTGIVATKNITDATPAAFTAHVAERTMQTEIAAQQLEKLTDGTLDICLGGGQKYYDAKKNKDELKKAKKNGVTYAKTWKKAKASELPLAGIFSKENMDTTNEKMPKVAEMADLALERLSEDEDGFFLMIEGSQIDTYGHSNNFNQEMEELYDFDCAVEVVMDFVQKNPDTVVVITADHETGDLQIPAELTNKNKRQVYYTTEEHTNKVVPVLAYGYGTDMLEGLNENTDIARFMASLLGEEEFGQTSVFHDLDSDLKGVGDIENTRAVHITVENEGKTVEAPRLRITMKEGRGYAYCQTGYVREEETAVLSYILPEKCWNMDGENPILNLELYYRNGRAVELDIKNYEVTQRVAGK